MIAKNSKENYEVVKKEMEDFWPVLKETITKDKFICDIELSDGWLENLLQRNVPDGKKFRGLGMVMFFRSHFDEDLLANNGEVKNFEGEVVTKDQLYAMAWGIEITQAACLIADDLMDNSATRRGKPCWHLVEGVGLLAVNDILLLENVAYRILDKYCKNMSFFKKIVRGSHKTAVRTLLGEHLDIKSELHNINGNLSLFTEERYAKIVEYKTSYYTFASPAECAMILAGRNDKQERKMVRDIFLEIGYLFQVQDDYIDCFGDPKVTGKIGTDIVDGKCTWLIVKALQLASAEQKERLQKFYGNGTAADNEAKVKAIYRDLKIPKEFLRFEEEKYREIGHMIGTLPENVPTEQLRRTLKVIYRRDR